MWNKKVVATITVLTEITQLREQRAKGLSGLLDPILMSFLLDLSCIVNTLTKRTKALTLKSFLIKPNLLVERQSDKMVSCHTSFQRQGQHTQALGLGKLGKNTVKKLYLFIVGCKICLIVQALKKQQPPHFNPKSAFIYSLVLPCME